MPADARCCDTMQPSFPRPNLSNLSMNGAATFTRYSIPWAKQ